MMARRVVLWMGLVAAMLPGLVLPACDPCGGKKNGKCGLDGFCVECNFDSDCKKAGTVCSLDGVCVDNPQPCTLDSDCTTSGTVCHSGSCATPCTKSSTCDFGAVCSDGVCTLERCGTSGNCPTGWTPVAGSLECRYTGT